MSKKSHETGIIKRLSRISMAGLLGALLLTQRGDARAPGQIRNTGVSGVAAESVLPGSDFLQAQIDLANNLEDGKPTTVISAIAVCAVGKDTIAINQPMVVEKDGHTLIGGPVVDSSDAGFSIRLYDEEDPGAPTQDTPACELFPDPASTTPFLTRYQVRLANPGDVHKGGAFTFVYDTNGQQVPNQAGDPLEIGLIYTPKK